MRVSSRIATTNHLNVLLTSAAERRLEAIEHPLFCTGAHEAHARLVELPARHGYTKQENLSRNLARRASNDRGANVCCGGAIFSDSTPGVSPEQRYLYVTYSGAGRFRLVRNASRTALPKS